LLADESNWVGLVQLLPEQWQGGRLASSETLLADVD
jgi:hypothetical protein